MKNSKKIHASQKASSDRDSKLGEDLWYAKDVRFSLAQGLTERQSCTSHTQAKI